MGCYGTRDTPMECPTPYGGGFSSSDEGDDIVEYEVEYNERPNFGGSDGGTKIVTSTTCTLLNLIPGRPYYVRVLARNTIGSGKFCERNGSNVCDGALVSVIVAT